MLFTYELKGFVNIFESELLYEFKDALIGWAASSCFEKIAMRGPKKLKRDPSIILLIQNEKFSKAKPTPSTFGSVPSGILCATKIENNSHRRSFQF